VIPVPAGLRLVTLAAPSLRPKPPFGLRAWQDSADAAAVVLETEGEAVDVDAVAAQLPPVAALPAGTCVFVLGAALRKPRRWPGWGSRTVPVPRTVRCAALLALGYWRIGAAVDAISRADVAWGFSSPC
jgi:hypothetical protein